MQLGNKIAITTRLFSYICALYAYIHITGTPILAHSENGFMQMPSLYLLARVPSLSIAFPYRLHLIHLLIVLPTANQIPWKWSSDRTFNQVLHTYACNND